MGNSAIWASVDPFAGPATAGSTTQANTDASVGQLGTAAVVARPSVWSPQHPMLWFGAVAGVTLGLIAVSTHVRVGPFKASASAGKGI
jgi:hypothetical protein